MNKNEFLSTLKTSITLRFVAMCVLSLLLLIPMTFVEDLIRERHERKTEVVNEIKNTWSKEQHIKGPFLRIPCEFERTIKVKDTDAKKLISQQEIYSNNLIILPTHFDLQSTIDASEKHRSLYVVQVYGSKNNVKATFDLQNIQKKYPNIKKINWDAASFVLEYTDVKGLTEAPKFSLNGNAIPHQKAESSFSQTAIEFPFKNIENQTTAKVELSFSLRGTSDLKVAPIGDVSTISMKSNWPHPNFIGDFSSTNTVKDGFEAQWDVLEINRSFGSQFFDNKMQSGVQGQYSELPNSNVSQFVGVNLKDPADAHQQNTRAVKYALFIIALTFLGFLLFELNQKTNRGHFIQYTLIGFAICLFYTLLLAFSEHLGFVKSYFIAFFMICGLLAWFTTAIYKKIQAGLVISLILSFLYGFTFVTLQLEDKALMVGALGLFVMLAATMYFTRNINKTPSN